MCRSCMALSTIKVHPRTNTDIGLPLWKQIVIEHEIENGRYVSQLDAY
jgi:hypothetical protein